MASGQIEGMEALLSKLNKLASLMTESEVEAAMRAGAMLITNRAKSLAPYETGTLRRSIHEQVVRVGDGIVARIGVPSLADDGTDLGYAVYQEFGTSRMTAHPYLRPAFNEQRDAAIQEVGEAMKEIIRHHAG